MAYPPGFTGLGRNAFELLAAPPSPHGWRLQQVIGLGSVRADVRAFEATNGRVSSVSAGDRVLRVDAFVLATGHHIGGGIESGSVHRERLFGLGVFRGGKPAPG